MPSPRTPHRPRRLVAGLATAAVLGSGAVLVGVGGGGAAASYPVVGPLAAASVGGTAQVGGFVTGPLGSRVDGVLVRAFAVGSAPGAASVASAITYAQPDGPDRNLKPDAAHGWYALHLPPGDYRLTFESSPGTRPFVPEEFPRTVTVVDAAQQLETVSLDDGEPNAAPTATTAPGIDGRPEVGEDLLASAGVWSIDGLVHTWAWTADGQPLDVDGPELVVTRDLAGRRLAVTVTAARPGWETGSAASAPVQVRRLATRVAGELDRDVLRPGQRARVDLEVAPRAVTGGWEVVVDGRAVASGSFDPADRGRASVLLPVLRSGRHDVRVSYVGDRAHAPSTDAVGDLVVRRRR